MYITQTFVTSNLVTGEKELISNDKNYNTLIDFLLEEFPDGFDKPCTIYVNTEKIELENYDVPLTNKDLINIVYHPAAAAVAIFAVKVAVGLAIGMDMRTDIDWIADRTSWLSNGMMKAGSVVRDEGGLVKVLYDKTA